MGGWGTKRSAFCSQYGCYCCKEYFKDGGFCYGVFRPISSEKLTETIKKFSSGLNKDIEKYYKLTTFGAEIYNLDFSFTWVRYRMQEIINENIKLKREVRGLKMSVEGLQKAYYELKEEA